MEPSTDRALERPRRGRAEHLAYASFALLVGLGLCELGLRAGNLATRVFDGRSAGAAEGRPVLLCHGDSNVYGIYERAEDAFPARLQALLERSAEGTPPVVENRAVPGLSTRHVLESLREDLEDVACVVVTAGVNNAWSWQPGSAYESPPWHETLRLVELARLLLAPREARGGRDVLRGRIAADPAAGTSLVQQVTRDGAVVRFEGRHRNLDHTAMRETIVRDLTEIDRLLGEAGIPWILSTYGSDESTYGVANEAMRAVAARLDVPLADASADLAALGRRLGFEAVFHRDLHPRAIGYEAIARRVHDELRALGLAAAGAAPVALEDLEPAAEVPPDVRFVRDRSGPLQLEIRGALPGADFAVTLWGARPRGSPMPWKSFPALWEEDPVFRATTSDPRLSGTFDEEGVARVPLAALLPGGGPAEDALGRLSGLDVEACFATKDDAGIVGYVSPVVTVTIP